MTTPSTSRDTAGIVEVPGARLRYRIEGHGQPCLVIGSSICYPRIFSQELREHLQLVFVDHRHFVDLQTLPEDDQALPPDQITLDTYAADMEQVRESLGLGDVIVIGHSIHGMLALEYARRQPQHLLGAVAIGALPHISADDPDEADRIWQAEASKERKELLARQLAELTPEVRATLSPEELFVREYVASSPRIWYDAGYDCSWLWVDVVPYMTVWSRLVELLEQYDLAQGPGDITVPVLIAQGRYDGGLTTLWEQHRHKLPTHTYALFERSAHFPSMEEQPLFDQTLLDWIAGLSTTGAAELSSS
jgi:proline iminopeptidase